MAPPPARRDTGQQRDLGGPVRPRCDEPRERRLRHQLDGRERQSGDTSGTWIKARILALDGPPVNGVVKDGDEGNDILRGTPRDDILRGHAGKDWLFGGKGDDRLEGGKGNDTIFGGKGDDAVLAGAGHDRIWTGKGSDLVVFKEGDGKDRVFDFDQRRGGNDHSFDRVQLDVSIGTNAIDDFDELQASIASGDIGVSTGRAA